MKKLLLLFLIAITTIIGQNKEFSNPQIEFSPKTYVCYRAIDMINIDGKINGVEWANVPWTETFVDIEGSKNPNPYFRTRVKMLWDDAYFYFAAEMIEENFWGKLTARDAVIYHDNDFEIFIDPDNDTHNYYELEVNALNTVWDLLLMKPYRDGKQVALTDWDIKNLKTAVNVQGTINDASDVDSSWTLEVAIPWNTFREVSDVNLPPSENDQWRVNFSRVQWEMEIDNGIYKKAKDPITNRNLPEKNWVWSPQGIIAMHYPEMWGYVQFSYKVVNHGEDQFLVNSDEEIRWLLREIYYKQRTHQLNHKTYTHDLKKLDLEDEKFIKFGKNLAIQATNLRFNASINLGDKIFTIYEDGKVEVKEIMK